jgi:long-chain fatty acid transport protein
MGSGDKVRSEVGVARLIVPLAYQVNNQLTVGGSLDWVRATMDLKMAVPAGAFAPSSMGGLVAGSSAGWDAALAGLGGAGATWGRFDFSDDSDYGGMAQGTGFAGKLGFTFQATPELSIGGVYQNETALGDLKATGATLSAGNAGGTLGSFHGDIKVRDFQWPTTIGLGMAYKASDAVLVVADVKQLQWSGVMKDFKMTFSSDAMGDLDVVMPQDWDDQTVVQLGVGYQVNPSWTLRAGYNHASNPVPDDTVSPLFPAIVETHYTFGAGYAINQASDVNFSYTLAPEVTVTGSGSMNNGMKISHSQSNWQLMYSNRF